MNNVLYEFYSKKGLLFKGSHCISVDLVQNNNEKGSVCILLNSFYSE